MSLGSCVQQYSKYLDISFSPEYNQYVIWGQHWHNCYHVLWSSGDSLTGSSPKYSVRGFRAWKMGQINKLSIETSHCIRLAALAPLFIHSSSFDCGDWWSLWWPLSASSLGLLFCSSHAHDILFVNPLRFHVTIFFLIHSMEKFISVPYFALFFQSWIGLFPVPELSLISSWIPTFSHLLII